MGQIALVDYPELPATLTADERDMLQQCEQTIADGLDTFYAVGNALGTVNRQKLYRENYSTFEAYCREKWQMGKAQAYRLIDADQVRENLSPIGDEIELPQKESHIRALKKAPANLQADIWSGVQMSGEPVTAQRIEEAVQEVLPEPVQQEKPQIINTYDTTAEKVTKTEVVDTRTLKHIHLNKYYDTQGWGVCKIIEYDAVNMLYLGENIVNGKQHYLKPETIQEGREVETCLKCQKRYLKSLMDDEIPRTCKTCAQAYRERPPRIDVEDAFETRLERCIRCLGKYYNTDRGIVYIDEVNEHMALVRGVTYPWPPHSQKYAAMTANFELEELLNEVEEADWLRAKQHVQPGEQTEDTTEKNTHDETKTLFMELQQEDIDIIATMADEDMKREFARHDEPCDLMITSGMVKCVLDVLRDYDSLQLASRDRDRIMQTGLRLYRASEYDKTLKQYTKANSTRSYSDEIEITWGSWKTAERFKTKKALKDRVKELEQEPDVIFDGRI